MKALKCITFMMDRLIEEKLIQRVHAFDTIEISEIVKNRVRLVEKMNRTNIDVLFINLDNKDVRFSEIIKLIQKPPFIIGITDKKTNLQTYLDLGVFDFLNTKVELEDICHKISKILNIYNGLFPKIESQVNEAIPEYYASKNPPKMKSHTFVRYKRMNIKVVYDDILFIKNTGNCLRIESTNNKVCYHDSTMKQFFAMLPPGNFIRINKSIIVNYNRIDKYKNDTIYIKNQSFKVSRVFAARLKDMLRRLS